jgi:hypothetical protein
LAEPAGTLFFEENVYDFGPFVHGDKDKKYNN